MTTKDFKVQENQRQITFIRKGRIVGERNKLPGIIVIQKIPQINFQTAKVIGFTFSVRSSEGKGSRGFTRFKKKSNALKFARSLMQ